MAMSPVLDASAIAARRDLNGNTTAAATRARTSSAANSPRKSKKTIINWLVNSSSNSSSSCGDSDNNNPKANTNPYPNPNTNPHPNPHQNPSTNQNCSCESRAFRDFRGVQTLRLLWSKRIKSASEEASSPGCHSSSSSSSLGTLKKLNKSVSCLVNAFNNSRDSGSPEKSLAKRAASLHNLQEANTRSLQLQREKDNFYKYKNAEQARMRAKLGSQNENTSEKRLKSDDSNSPAMAVLSAADKAELKPEEEATEAEAEEEQVELRAKRERNRDELFSLSAASAHNGGGSSESVNTANSHASTSISSSNPPSTATVRSGGRRKYSFKTHAGRSYHQPHHHSARRISSMDSSSSGGGAGGISLVAKLTQQFNEIIQKDARLLEQVKRNNGVWLSRGTHVYKIVEKHPSQAEAESGVEGSRISMVQRNIKKFEKLEKPSVPLKSEQLMRKHHELMVSTSNARGGTLQRGGPRIKRNLKLPAGSPGIPELAVVSEEVKSPKEQATEPKLTPKESSVPKEPREVKAEKSRDDVDFAPGQEEEEDLRQKQRKHKYSAIYEKLRFTFAKGRKSASPSPTKGRSKEEVSLDEEEVTLKEEVPQEKVLKEEAPPGSELRLQIPKEEVPQENIPNPSNQEDPSPVLPLAPCFDADSKILDALEAVDSKLKVLNPPSEMSSQEGELLLGANEDFEQRILPNNSFVYQAANKQISNNQILLNQAVNVTLVNAIEGEQMIMEQKQLLKELKAEKQGEENLLEPESLYEPITPIGSETKTEPPASSLFKIAAQKPAEIVEDIYQTLEETTTTASAKPKLNIWLEGYESIAGSQESSPPAFDGYECIGIEEMVSTPIILGTGTLGRNTRDQLPELPKPMRVLAKSAMPQRPAPPKPGAKESEEDENIYDTIKGCYESMHCKTSSSSSSSGGGATLTTDAISLNSNCYESISHFRKARMEKGQNQGTSCIQLSSSGSTLTISSDHKTNSLYESSLAATGCVVYGSASVGCRSSLDSSAGSRDCGKPGDKRSSIAGSSDNSDAWVDISDGEHSHAAVEVATEAQFIVVRERFKPHRTRSPDWSKRIRDKRLQKKAISCIEDDSDHYYETLSPLGNKRHSTQLLCPHQEVGRSNGTRSSHRRSKNHSASAHALGERVVISDDYDSFETDSDEPGEEEPNQRQRNHNDSGVDMRNHRLPKPPPAQNQVYEFVRKFKDFISSKKSPKGSQQKLYENTPPATQFYVESTGKRPAEVAEYENTEYGPERHTPTTTSPHQEQPPVLRAKQKNGKSLRSRLRKSLVGSSFDTKHLASLAETRSTFYVEDPEGSLPALQLPSPEIHGSGELDSGFCEKSCTPTVESQKFSTVARKAKKEAKATRRRTTIGLRPHDPPPPPPPSNGVSKTPTDMEREQEPGQTTSWYAECGVFKQASNSVTSPRGDEPVTPTPSAGGVSSWYAESGLYQTSGISVASSSGSSGVSTGNEAGLGDELNSEPHSLFSNEPLYQMYSAAKLESITRDLEAHESSADGYEEIGQHAKLKQEPQAKPRPTALQLVEPKNGPSRTLWSEIPEVIQSCILPTLTSRERSLQEAKFEIITSEASYLKSLNLLRRHFMNHSAFVDTSVLSGRDRKALFSYIVPVHECSERLLTELEACWQDNIMLLGLSRCIYEIAERHFHVYVAFCEHQGRMDRTLRRLKESKESSAFQQHLERLELSPSCCGLNLHSFLMLPMQRITRLPLLIDAVFSKESPLNREEYESWKLTLALVQKIVAQCNEAANRWEQAYELERIARQLEFPSNIRALAIAPMGLPRAGAKPRFLVKRGELTHLMWRGEDAKLTFGKRLTKSSIYAFLFSDLLVLCKRRGESSFTVFDYCPRSMLTLAAGDTLPQLPTKDLKDQAGKNLMLMTLLENCERKTIELVLSCPSVSDQQRWLQAMRPPEAETPGEKLYESWDCPQVVAKHSYESDEPDVLQLELGDVVNVSRKLPDGWYQGERIRDGAVGWFPGSYTEELNSAHVRARNLKQRHRLLTFTATYLEAQKGK